MNNLFKTILAISIAVFAVLTPLLIYVQSNKYLKQKAVQECMLAGKDEYDFPLNNSKSSTFNKESYAVCIQEKGYQTNIR